MSKIHILFSFVIILLISIASTSVFQQTNSIQIQESSLVEEKTSIYRRDLVFSQYSKDLFSHLESMIETIELFYKIIHLSDNQLKLQMQHNNQYETEHHFQRYYDKLFLEINSLVKETEKLDQLPVNVQSFLKDFSQNKKYEQFQVSKNIKEYNKLSILMNNFTSVLQTITISLNTQKEVMQKSPFEWPLKGGHITSYYGNRISPFGFNNEFHKGIDIANKYNTPVYATASGNITSTSYSSIGYGNKIVIKHGYGYSTTYAHLNRILTQDNTYVEQGEIIGHLGSSGRSTGPHLHYEIKLGSNHINPLNYIISSE